jgi:hypothetical protein
MERFVRTLAQGVNRRAFLGQVGRLGMCLGAAAAVLFPVKAAAQELCPNNGGACGNKNVGDLCFDGRGRPGACLAQENNGRCRCMVSSTEPG